MRWLWVVKTCKCLLSPRAITECACAPQQWDTEHAAMAADCTGFEEKVEHVDI